jgi:predicted RNase H-like nuclease (RuvC/YqgF family)
MENQCKMGEQIQSLQEEISKLKQKIFTLKCEAEEMHDAFVEAKDMLRIVRVCDLLPFPDFLTYKLYLMLSCF